MLLELKGVSKFYQNEGNVQLGLRKASITLHSGEFVAITGESGSGKSTLLNVISGLDKYDEGEMFLNGEATSYFSVEDLEKYRKEYVGFIFQDYNIIDAYTVYENVVAALVLQNYPKEKRKARALDLIKRVGLLKQKNQKTVKLSGGQKQRVVIARALAKDAPIIVADEPTGNLDAKSGEMVMALLKEVSKEKLVIVVTHNYEQVKPYATRRVHLFDGEIIEDKVLKPVDYLPLEASNNKPINWLGHLYFAAINLLRNPKKSLIVLLTYIILLVGTLGVVGAQKSGASTPYTRHPFVSNVFDERVLVKKADGSNFTNADLETLYSNTYAKSVIHHDRLLDTLPRLEVGADANRVNILPASAKVALANGRLPENDQEIVLPNWYVGKNPTTAKLSYEDGVIPFEQTFTVVGFAKLQQTIVHDSFLNQTTTHTQVESDLFTATFEHDTMSIMLDDSYKVYLWMGIKQGDSENVVMSTGFLKTYGLEVTETSVVKVFYQDKEYNFNVETIEDSEAIILIPKAVVIADGFEVTQTSVILKNPLDANKFIKSLGDSFIANHPASYNMDAGLNVFSAIEMVLLVNAVIFSLIILNIVIRNVYRAKNKDIAIMRSIGSAKRDIRKIYVLETLLTVMISTIVSLVIVFLLGKFAFKIQILRILGLSSIVLYVLLFLGLGLWIINRFLNRLFGRTVIQTLRGGSND